MGDAGEAENDTSGAEPTRLLKGRTREIWETFSEMSKNDRITLPVDPDTASDPASYRMSSYTYKLHSPYGSPEVETQEPTIQSVAVADDGLSALLTIEGLRAGYVHELHAEGVRSAEGLPLLHDEAYYTLIERPEAD